MSLSTVTEDIPPGSKNWMQKITDRWAAVNANFALLLSKINAVAAAAVKTVNGAAPDSDGNVTLTVPTGADVQVFTASGVWTKPANAKQVTAFVRSGGTGGWGGGRPAAYNGGWGLMNSAPYADGGIAVTRVLHASDLPASVAVAVGAGGVGGAGMTQAQQVNETSAALGAAGAAPGVSSFGVYCIGQVLTHQYNGSSIPYAVADSNGIGLKPGTGARSVYCGTAGTQDNPGVPSTPDGGSAPSGGTGNAGGGGSNGANNASLAGNGGDGTNGATGSAGTGLGGLGSGGGAGGAGGWQTNLSGSSTARGGNGGNGGNGGFPGGGGGAGGPAGRPSLGGAPASRHGTGGKGGDGGAGVVVVVTTF